MSGQQKRRKKTREVARKANVRKLQTVVARQAANDDKMSWSKLAQVFEDCLNMYTPIHGLTPILASPAFREKATQDDCKHIKDAVQQLTGHVQATLGDLHDIRKKHFGRTGIVKGEKRTMEAIEIGMEYQNWVTKFNSTVIMLSMDISGRIEAILEPDQVVATPVSNEPLFADIDATPVSADTETPSEETTHHVE